MIRDKWLTSKEACRLLGVNYRTLWRWAKMGLIRYVKVPPGSSKGRFRYYREDVEKILRLMQEQAKGRATIYVKHRGIFKVVTINELAEKVYELEREVEKLKKDIEKLKTKLRYY